MLDLTPMPEIEDSAHAPACPEPAPSAPPAAVQTFGFLVAVDRTSWQIAHVSQNAEPWLGATGELIGRPLGSVLASDTVHALRGSLQTAAAAETSAQLLAVPLTTAGPNVDVAAYATGNTVVITCEPTIEEAHFEPALTVRDMTARLRQAQTHRSFLLLGGRLMRAVTGFSRVMVYLCDPDGTPRLVTEYEQPGQEPNPGPRYSATDDALTRHAFGRAVTLQMIPDTGAAGAPIHPAAGSHSLDLSRSILRNADPNHIAALRNSGVQASLMVPILRQDRLRGLFVCHHPTPHHVSAARRIAADLFGQMFSLLLESREHQQDAPEQALSQGRQQLVIAELNHRLRNILALIRGIISQSRKSADTIDAFTQVVGARIQALARAHEQIMAENAGPTLFTGLIRAEAAAYSSTTARRIVFTGPDVLITPDAFTTVALVIHEMITNSVKYGGLSSNAGLVDIRTERDALGRYSVSWQESGGPGVAPPTRRGFGSTVIEWSILHDLKGEVQMDFAPSGLHARFLIPAAHVRTAEQAPAADLNTQPLAEEPQPGPMPADVLVLEDNIIIALDLEETLHALGIRCVRIAASVAEGMRLIEERLPAFALLDVNLGHEMSLDLAARLAEDDIPFAFGSGYGEQVVLPWPFTDVPKLGKPYSIEELRSVIHRTLRRHPPDAADPA